MSDQCLKCNHFNRPDMCVGTDCLIKESWYCLYLMQRNTAALADKEAAVREMTESRDEWRREWRLMEAAEKKAEEQIANLKDELKIVNEERIKLVLKSNEQENIIDALARAFRIQNKEASHN